MEEWKWKKKVESVNQLYLDTNNKAQKKKVTTTTYLLFDDGGVNRAQVWRSDNNLPVVWLGELLDKDGEKTGEYIYTFRTAEDGKKEMWQRFEPEMLRNETGNHPDRKHKPI
jgi:hypothetical protein